MFTITWLFCYHIGMENKYKITANEAEIINLILDNPGLSKANIATLTGLNKSSITYICNKLFERDLIVNKRGVNAEGRNGTYIYFNYDIEQVLFLERSYDKLKVKVSNLDANLSYEQEYEVELDFNKQLENIVDYIKGNFPLIKSCIFTVHGRIDNYKKIVTSPFLEFSLAPIEELFEREEIRLHIENEAKVHALGLRKHTKDNVVVNIQIMAGVGSGIIIDNKLFDGSNGMAGELAHTIAVPNGKQCKCGNKGCFELYVCDSETLVRINKICKTKLSMNNISDIRDIDLNLLNKAMEEDILLLTNLINNLYVTLNPDEINITSRIYSQVDGFGQKLANNINFRNDKHTKINILNYNPNTNLRGFCELYNHLIFTI